MDLAQPGSIVAVAAIVFGVIGLWAHRAVGSPKGRDTIIRWLESGRWWQRYHDTLRDALDWLDRTIDPPAFAPNAKTARRSVGIKSLGVCLTLSMVQDGVFEIHDVGLADVDEDEVDHGIGSVGLLTVEANRQGIEEIGVRRGALVYKGPDPDPRYRHRR